VLFLWEPSRVRSGGCDVVVSKADHLRRAGRSHDEMLRRSQFIMQIH
jgi:hypothetical protein